MDPSAFDRTERPGAQLPQPPFAPAHVRTRNDSRERTRSGEITYVAWNLALAGAPAYTHIQCIHTHVVGGGLFWLGGKQLAPPSVWAPHCNGRLPRVRILSVVGWSVAEARSHMPHVVGCSSHGRAPRARTRRRELSREARPIRGTRPRSQASLSGVGKQRSRARRRCPDMPQRTPRARARAGKGKARRPSCPGPGAGSGSWRARDACMMNGGLCGWRLVWEFTVPAGWRAWRMDRLSVSSYSNRPGRACTRRAPDRERGDPTGGA